MDIKLDNHVWKVEVDKKNNYIFFTCVKCKEPMRTPVGTIAGRHLCILLK